MGPDRNRVKHAGRTAIAVGILFVLLLAGTADSAVAREAEAAEVVVDSSSTVTVTATTTFSFSPDVINEVPKATSITIDFINGDSNGLIHTFTLLGCPNVTVPRAGHSAYDFGSYLGGKKCSHAPLLNLTPPATSSQSQALTVATTGWYEFICIESGHFQSGMYGFIAFGTDVPANLTPASGTPGAGAAVFIIVGTIVTLTVIAIVLGFVIGRREGARHEMPPERLGYSEPGASAPPRPPARPPGP